MYMIFAHKCGSVSSCLLGFELKIMQQYKLRLFSHIIYTSAGCIMLIMLIIMLIIILIMSVVE